ncbi:MAG: hypothetical protein ACE5I7_03200 [Candidatus Binatia bacterium]
MIQLLSELLLGADSSRSEGETDLVQRIHANARRVIALALNVLDAGRIGTGRLGLQRTQTDLARIVGEAVSLAESASTPRTWP